MILTKFVFATRVIVLRKYTSDDLRIRVMNIFSPDLKGLVALKREVDQAVYFPEINNVESMITSISTNTNDIIDAIILLAFNGDYYRGVHLITTTVYSHLE